MSEERMCILDALPDPRLFFSFGFVLRTVPSHGLVQQYVGVASSVPKHVEHGLHVECAFADWYAENGDSADTCAYDATVFETYA